jgi:hypothetical protein
MGMSSRENSQRARPMARDYISGETERSTMASGLTVSSRGTACGRARTVNPTLDSGRGARLTGMVYMSG